MLSRSVPRFLLEAAFLVAAAAVAALAHLDAVEIVIVMAGAFVLVVVGEWAATTRGKGHASVPVRARAAREPPEPVAVPAAPLVTAAPRRATRPVPRPSVTRVPTPGPTSTTPRPRAPATAAAASTAVRPVARPPLPVPVVTVPDVPDRPVPPGWAPPARPAPRAPAAAPPPPRPPAPLEPPPAPVAPRIERRSWNVFDLEQRARAAAGRDHARNEEVALLLLYLREFADISGELSKDFDPFVREAFPELIA